MPNRYEIRVWDMARPSRGSVPVAWCDSLPVADEVADVLRSDPLVTGTSIFDRLTQKGLGSSFKSIIEFTDADRARIHPSWSEGLGE